MSGIRRARQTGMTLISVLVLLVMGGFFILLLLKLGPIYLENYTVRSVLEQIRKEPLMGSRPPGEVRRAIEDRLYVNEVRRLNSQDFRIKREGQVLKIELDYTVREAIMGNVDALVTFSERVELQASE
jgi:hypothetical protein